MPINFTYDAYVDDVVNGRITACRWVKLACERHVNDLEHGHERGLWFDERAARIAIAFFSVLRHWKGEWAGKPINLEPCQQFWVASIFGWKREDGYRRFETAYLEVARKNTKTTFAAGLGLYTAFVEGESGAEVYTAATKKDQAKICFNDAKQMVMKSPQLRNEIGIYRNNLHNLSSGSKLEPVSSDESTLDGLNIHVAIGDELHAWKGVGLWGVLKTAMGSRLQPLMLGITTAGIDQQGICYQQREYLARILQGIVEDDAYFGIIYTLDTKKDWPDLEDDDDWQDEGNWPKANPLLGVSKYVRYMRNEARKAANNPSELNNFLRWHLNIWTQAVTRWVNPIHWATCGEYEVDEEALIGRRCYGGLDLSQIYDLTALVLQFPPEEDDSEEPHQIICRFWLPEENMLERVRKDRVPYDVWVRMGFITLTPGNVIDYDFIVYEVGQLMEKYDLIEIGFDRWGATKIQTELMDMGGDEFVVPIGQGFASMSPPMKDLGVKIADGTLAHGNNPVLNWMADNLVARTDPAGNLKPDKEKSREKIDGMTALIMSNDRASRYGGVSKYETEDLLVL